MAHNTNLKKEVFYLARQRVRQLNSNFRDIVETGNTEAVHDFRKATRRLQSIVDISGLHRHPGRAKKLHRELQDFRQAAGEWRDSDVILHELKQMQGRDRAARDCWQILSRRIEEQRDRNANRFVQRQKARAVKRLGSKAKAFVKHGLQSKSLSNNMLRAFSNVLG